MASVVVPSSLENFELFIEGKRSLGIVDITLPKLTAKTVDIEGAGIGGTISLPTQGQTDNLEAEFNFRVVTDGTVELAQIKAHTLEAYGAINCWNASEGAYQTKQVRVSMRAIPSEFDLGKLASASTMDHKATMTLSYLKVSVDGTKMIEIDKFNYIQYLYGTDYLAATKAALGL